MYLLIEAIYLDKYHNINTIRVFISRMKLGTTSALLLTMSGSSGKALTF
jgi:hypothetical protein